MNKNLIKKRFTKNLANYNQNAKIQKRMAEKLFQIAGKNFYRNILEIGCGTGLLTEIINKNCKYESFIANDIVLNCKEYINSINPKIEFLNGDIEEILPNLNKNFDLIISNASFQWIEELEKFINKLYDKLTPDGNIVFSTFGVENYREIKNITGNTLNYYSSLELKRIFNRYETIIDEEIHILSFKSPMEVLKHMKHTGVNAIEEKIWTKTDMKNFENGYSNFCSGNYTLTYHPIYVKIQK